MMESTSESIAIWLKKVCGSENSAKTYLPKIKRFFDHVGTQGDELVARWKKLKYDLRLREEFLDKWTDKIESYIYFNFQDYTSGSRMQELAVIVSFFKNCCARGIPVSPKWEKHTFVKYHNRDIKREEIKRILEHSSKRDKAFFLMLTESGLRPETLVQLRYKHIKEDFEANRTPMKIDLPSELLKGRVEHRWNFIGEDGFKVLKEYLKPRLPLKHEDLVFIPRRKDAPNTLLTRNTFSVIFSNLALKLGIAERTEKGKPKTIRLYCLRKYFMNNARYEGFDHTFKEFWMGHKTTQTHYVSRDIERHRKEYAQAYRNLRIYRDETEQSVKMLKNLLAEKDKELSELRKKLKAIEPFVEFAEGNPEALQILLNKSAPQEKKRLLRWMTRVSRDRHVREPHKAITREHRKWLIRE